MSTAVVIDLRSHASQINEQHRDCVTSYGHALSHAFEAGRLLAEVKEEVGHGSFGAWIEENCEFSDRTARVYMQVAANSELIDRQSPAEMSISQTLRQISKPREPNPARPERVSVGEMGDLFAGSRPATDRPAPDARHADIAGQPAAEPVLTEQQARKRDKAVGLLDESRHLAMSVDRLSKLGARGVLGDAARQAQQAAVALANLSDEF